MPVILGAGAFVLGVAGTYVYVSLQSRQSQIAEMAAVVEQLQLALAADVVTRNAAAFAPDVPQIAPEPAAASAAEEVSAPGPQLAGPDAAITVPEVAIPESAVPVVAVPPEAVAVPTPQPVAAALSGAAPPTATQTAPETASAAERIKSIVLEGTAGAQIDDETMQRARRLETLAIIDAGVQDLVAAVVAGQYDIHTNYADADFSGRIHFAFVGREEDQSALERFLAEAAGAGIVAHSASVVSGDGSVNGHIMLFDLVERALDNGTAEEQRAGEAMRAQAVAMLAATVEVGEPETAAGERFYVVEAGDSLAYIALQFYGNTNDFARIFDANRDILRTPDRIQIGQRLLIPGA